MLRKPANCKQHWQGLFSKTPKFLQIYFSITFPYFDTSLNDFKLVVGRKSSSFAAILVFLTKLTPQGAKHCGIVKKENGPILSVEQKNCMRNLKRFRQSSLLSKKPSPFFHRSLQLSLNPLDLQVAALIEAGEDNQWEKKKIHTKNHG